MEKYITSKTRVYNCGNCHKVLDAVTGKAIPKQGDISVCINCGEITEFDNDLTMKPVITPRMQTLQSDHPNIYKSIMLLSNNLKRGFARKQVLNN